jgi:hypothetical protein
MGKSCQVFSTREMMQIIRKLSILFLCGMMLVTQWACVRTVGPLGKNFIQKPITIGVTTGKFIPTTLFERSGTMPAETNRAPSIGSPGGLGGLVLMMAVLLLIAIGYGMYKIFEGIQELSATPDDPQEIPKTPEVDRQPILTPQEMLENALAELRMQEAFGEAFVTQARASTPHTFVMVKEYGPQTKAGLPSNYYELSEQELDMILELRIESFGLIGGVEDDPSFSLSMKVRVRLIGLPGQNNLYNNHFSHKSELRTFGEWADDHAQLFHEAITQAYEDLANQIIH